MDGWMDGWMDGRVDDLGLMKFFLDIPPALPPAPFSSSSSSSSSSSGINSPLWTLASSPILEASQQNIFMGWGCSMSGPTSSYATASVAVRII
jgi:hypothetical protein